MSSVLPHDAKKRARVEGGSTNEREREGGPTLEPAIVRSHLHKRPARRCARLVDAFPVKGHCGGAPESQTTSRSDGGFLRPRPLHIIPGPE